jgi:hypothetical protein
MDAAFGLPNPRFGGRERSVVHLEGLDAMFFPVKIWLCIYSSLVV